MEVHHRDDVARRGEGVGIPARVEVVADGPDGAAVDDVDQRVLFALLETRRVDDEHLDFVAAGPLEDDVALLSEGDPAISASFHVVRLRNEVPSSFTVASSVGRRKLVYPKTRSEVRRDLDGPSRARPSRRGAARPPPPAARRRSSAPATPRGRRASSRQA